MSTGIPQTTKLFGHPVGLYTLFFAEMWERFSYYGMRALLVFYMIKGFLHYEDDQAYTIYGAYTALVYMTPFFGGMLADRLLGARRAVILGGLLMAGGHLMMTVQQRDAFFVALALLICGNGFFKPNISTIVGTLYAEGSPKRDGGFTIFYMGINLGAAMSPLICGYIGETYGWHKGFGLATIGMLTGVAVFVAPTVVSQVFLLAGVVASGYSLYAFEAGSPSATMANLTVGACLVLAGLTAFISLGRERSAQPNARLSTFMNQLLIAAGAISAAFLLFTERSDNNVSLFTNSFVAVSLLGAATIACFALSRGGLPHEAGAPSKPERLRRRWAGVISNEYLVYLGALLSIPVFMLFVSGFEQVSDKPGGIKIVSDEVIANMEASPNPVMRGLAESVKEVSRPAGLVLFLAGFVALIYLLAETFRMHRIQRERMFVVLILTFYSFLFWSFFEQSGSSINNFTDRNVDRVATTRFITADQVGTTIRIQPTQEQLGYHNGDKVFTIRDLNTLREHYEADATFQIDWTVAEDNVGMGIADRVDEIPASTFQSFNPIYILVFGLIFTALWAVLGAVGMEPSTPFKFALGLLQLGLGFAAFWYGAETADERGMVWVFWLVAGYLLHTTGELCLSPVGLSMVTKLSPAYLVSTVMGTWFLATAFAQYLAAIIAQFTAVSTELAPSHTVHVYGNVFGMIAIVAVALSLTCFALVPLLKRWMH
jgi:POT family proton-dependent oligopeptide transporter